jgi:peptidoglycan hydrolase-like protein with peptidoglycan-binding domain
MHANLTRSRTVQRPASAATPRRAPALRRQGRVAPSHPVVQAKLKVGPTNDRFEQEAERAAQTVMRLPESGAVAVSRGEAHTVQRTCAACQQGGLCAECAEEDSVRRQPIEEEEGLLQTKPTTGNVPSLDPIVEGRIHALQGGGQPLPSAERSFFEPRFGADFSRVRIHAGAQAAQAAAAIQARAFTVGPDIAFGQGEYQAGSGARNRVLMAHELAHVVQQGCSPSRDQGGVIQRQPAVADAAATDVEPASSLFAGDATLVEVLNNRAVLRRGHSGDAVRRLQDALLQEGYPLPNFGADGKFGPETETAVRMFQERWRLDVDGIVGDQTLGLLDGHLIFKGILQSGEEQGGFIGGILKGLGAGALDLSESHFATTACPAANQAERLTACIQPVVIAENDGSNPTQPPPFAVAQRIWEKCCINYSVLPTQTINNSDFKVLDESVNNIPTAEQVALFAAAGASNCIQVFIPETFEQGGVISKAISGGGAAYDGGAANAKVVLVEGAVSEVVAHELGHASGFGGHDANPTVMQPSGAHNVPNPTAVSQPVCTQARTGAILATTGGKPDCCMDFR